MNTNAQRKTASENERESEKLILALSFFLCARVRKVLVCAFKTIFLLRILDTNLGSILHDILDSIVRSIVESILDSILDNIQDSI